MCHCGDTGVERTPNKSQHTKLSPEKVILPPLLLGFELADVFAAARYLGQEKWEQRRSGADFISLPFLLNISLVYAENSGK